MPTLPCPTGRFPFGNWLGRIAALPSPQQWLGVPTDRGFTDTMASLSAHFTFGKDRRSEAQHAHGQDGALGSRAPAPPGCVRYPSAATEEAEQAWSAVPSGEWPRGPRLRASRVSQIFIHCPALGGVPLSPRLLGVA